MAEEKVKIKIINGATISAKCPYCEEQTYLISLTIEDIPTYVCKGCKKTISLKNKEFLK